MRLQQALNGIRNGTVKTIEKIIGYLGSEEVEKIAQALESNTSVTNVVLNRNEAGNAGAAALGKMLEKNRTVQELNLSRSSISNEGADALIKGLEGNYVLVKLDLLGNSIGAEKTERIKQLLARNALIERMENTSLGLETEIPSFVERLKQQPFDVATLSEIRTELSAITGTAVKAAKEQFGKSEYSVAQTLYDTAGKVTRIENPNAGDVYANDAKICGHLENWRKAFCSSLVVEVNKQDIEKREILEQATESMRHVLDITVRDLCPSIDWFYEKMEERLRQYCEENQDGRVLENAIFILDFLIQSPRKQDKLGKKIFLELQLLKSEHHLALEQYDDAHNVLRSFLETSINSLQGIYKSRQKVSEGEMERIKEEREAIIEITPRAIEQVNQFAQKNPDYSGLSTLESLCKKYEELEKKPKKISTLFCTQRELDCEREEEEKERRKRENRMFA